MRYVTPVLSLLKALLRLDISLAYHPEPGRTIYPFQGKPFIYRYHVVNFIVSNVNDISQSGLVD
jgi:hypothetical protein